MRRRKKTESTEGAGRRNIPKPTAEDNGAKDPYGKSNQIRAVQKPYLREPDLSINLVSNSSVDGGGVNLICTCSYGGLQ